MKHIQLFFLLTTFAFAASAQNVGIGNATPLVPLSFASTLGNKISLYGSNTTSIYGLGVQGGALQMFADNAASNIVFGYGSSTAFTERMRIMGNGNVGIGINTPTASLQVARGAGIDGTARFQGTQYSSHFNYNTAEQTYIRGGLATSEVLINDQGSGNVRIADAGGNVGIGIENGNNPTAKLHVNGTMKITDGTQGAGKILTSNAVGGASWVSPPIISAFSARSIGEQIISPPYSKILFNNLLDIQSGSAYNPNNSTFTAPVSGYYQFNVTLYVLPAGQQVVDSPVIRISLNKNSSTNNAFEFRYSPYMGSKSFSEVVYLNENDIMEVYIRTSITILVGGSTFPVYSIFSGFKIN